MKNFSTVIKYSKQNEILKTKLNIQNFKKKSLLS